MTQPRARDWATVRRSSTRHHIGFPEDLWARVTAYATRHGCTSTAVVVAAVTEFLDRHDDDASQTHGGDEPVSTDPRARDEARPEKGFTHAQRTASDNASV
jgi:hypothetical protein